MAGYELQTIALCQRRHTQLRFDERELVADALPRSGAKREIDVLRTIGAELRREALGLERVRVLPVRGQAMQNVRDDKREPASRQTEPTERVVGECLPGEAPRRRVETHRLVNNHSRVGQVREIAVLRSAPGEYRVDLPFEPLTRRGMLRQQIPRPRERQGSRLLTGEEKRRDLDAQLLVCHA